MAATHPLKIYDANNRYQAACREPEAAASLMGFYGDGSTIRFGHTRKDIVWTEGNEGQSAYESFDYVAETVRQRVLEIQANWRQRQVVSL